MAEYAIFPRSHCAAKPCNVSANSAAELGSSALSAWWAAEKYVKNHTITITITITVDIIAWPGARGFTGSCAWR